MYIVEFTDYIMISYTMSLWTKCFYLLMCFSEATHLAPLSKLGKEKIIHFW